MALAGSLQLSLQLGLCKNSACHKLNNNYKNAIGNNKLQRVLFQRTALQKCGCWSIHHSNKFFGPINIVPRRSCALSCRSFLAPGGGSGAEIPVLKAASAALTRSYNVLQGSPVIVMLIPAISIITLAIWGIEPLMRQGRHLAFNKNDNNWKKSKTYYVTTSYIRPLLLWTGAILICRALEPIALPTEASQIIKKRLINFVGSLSTVLAFAYCLSSVIQQVQKYFMETSDSTDARNMGFQFAGRAVYSGVWVAAVSLFMELLGFSTQKWLTAGSLGTVLLTLAGREIFTNFLSSVMIHATRPFVVNEWIQTKIEGYEVSGTVEHVGWWSPTIVRGEDREAIHIPNHKFTMNVVRNLTQKSHWRIKTHLAISHLDYNKINNIIADMRKVLSKNPQVEQQRLHRRVFLENVNAENQALMIMISCFVKTSHHEEYFRVKEVILLDLLRVISHHGARLATPIRTVQKVYSDADFDSIPFADSPFNRSGVKPNRPLLLIEPSYKINGEDKSKSQTRATRTNGEQESKSSAKPTPDPKAESKAETTPKFDPKAKETPKFDKKENTEIGETPTPHIKQDLKVATASSTDPKENDHTASKGSNDSTETNKISDSRQPKSSSLGKTRQASKFNETLASTSQSNNDKASDISETSQLKQDDVRPTGTPSASRPALEDNIVLGVALEGSKRTLPIEEEEEETDSLNLAEAKKVAAIRNNQNGSPTKEKHRKDGQPEKS